MIGAFKGWLRGRPRADAAAAWCGEPPEDVARIVARVQPHTMTGPARIWALVEAVRYLARRKVPGAFVECGVWRGGSAMAMLLALQDLGQARDIHLYDTFEGMTEPTEHDRSDYSAPATETWRAMKASPDHAWHRAFDPQVVGLEAVRARVLGTGYPAERVHFIKGPVEATLPAQAPHEIALLRLDTDWYESTRHELEHLYPRLQPGGVLLIDDYGHWQGCRRAVDEYFARSDVAPVLLTHVDYTARLAIKA